MNDSRLCSHCSQPLIYVPFSKYYRLVCNNGPCLLFREGQGNIERDGSNEPERKGVGQPPRIYTPKYQGSLARIRENYRFARSFKIPSVIARDLRYKSRKEIEQAARGMVRV